MTNNTALVIINRNFMGHNAGLSCCDAAREWRLHVSLCTELKITYRLLLQHAETLFSDGGNASAALC